MRKNHWHDAATVPEPGRRLLALRQGGCWTVTTVREIGGAPSPYYEYTGRLYPWQGIDKWAYIDELESLQ